MHKEIQDEHEHKKDLLELVDQLVHSKKKYFVFALYDVDFDTEQTSYKIACFSRDLDDKLVEMMNTTYEYSYVILVKKYLDDLMNDTDRIIQ